MRQTHEVLGIVPGRVVRASVEGVIDDREGFRVLLRDHETDRILRIAFGSHVAYQNRDESDLDGEAARSDGLVEIAFIVPVSPNSCSTSPPRSGRL